MGSVCDGDWSEEAMRLVRRAVMDVPERGWKTAQKWIRDAEDQTEMYRHILMNVCNGSVDRMDMLLQSDDPIRLDEVYNEEAPRRAGDSGRPLYVGVDVGRTNDRTVITVVEKVGNWSVARAILRLSNMRLPEQQERLEKILALHDVRACKIDMTGLGLGLYEYTAKKFGHRVQGVNFASSAPLTERLRKEGRPGVSAPVTEVLATGLLQVFEDRLIQIPIDQALRDDLRKPERYVSPTGRVLIAATRSEAGHADHFWSLALAIDAAQTPVRKPFEYYSWLPKCRQRVARL